jgi:hypothetical protein
LGVVCLHITDLRRPLATNSESQANPRLALLVNRMSSLRGSDGRGELQTAEPEGIGPLPVRAGTLRRIRGGVSQPVPRTVGIEMSGEGSVGRRRETSRRLSRNSTMCPAPRRSAPGRGSSSKCARDDPLVCPRCGGAMRIVAFIEEPAVIDLPVPRTADREDPPPSGPLARPRPQSPGRSSRSVISSPGRGVVGAAPGPSRASPSAQLRASSSAFPLDTSRRDGGYIRPDVAPGPHRPGGQSRGGSGGIAGWPSARILARPPEANSYHLPTNIT